MSKILIIKLGADGDVLRTLPLAQAIKKKHPNSELTWLTRGDISSLIKAPYIDKILVLPKKPEGEFDLLYNFDIDDEASTLASSISARQKYGFYKDSGYAAAFNMGAEYYLNTIFDDNLKRTNKKTYQEMMFEAAELKYEKIRYHVSLDKEDLQYAEFYKKKENLGGKRIIGIHMGASSRWPSKVWSKDCLERFIKLAAKGHDIILFGGPNESKYYSSFAEDLRKKNLTFHMNYPNNTKKEFASLVNLCDYMVCNDSLALHVSLGLGKKTIALFFCTSPAEVEGYGLLTKLIAPRLLEFFPERSNEYDADLVSSISPEQVLESCK